MFDFNRTYYNALDNANEFSISKYIYCVPPQRYPLCILKVCKQDLRGSTHLCSVYVFFFLHAIQVGCVSSLVEVILFSFFVTGVRLHKREGGK